MKFKFIFLTALIVLVACKNSNTGKTPVETISVNAPDEITEASFKDFFDSWKLVPLETTKESLIGKIDRLSVYNDRFYILDRQTNSVFIFSSDGHFIKSIHNIGQGPGEYTGIMDFAIDKKKQQIIVHSHRPYRLIYYDLNGTFIKQEKLSTFYRGISCEAPKLIEINQSREMRSMAFVKDINNGDVEKFIPFSKKAEIFESFGTGFPYILQSEHTYITFPFEPLIYQYGENGITPKYRIDFGSHNIPETEFKEGNTAKKIYTNAKKNWLGISISNVRETRDHLSFSYGNSIIVIHNKKSGKTASFTYALNTKGSLPFQTYFGHDGNDNTLISVYEAATFVKQMQWFKEDDALWQLVPESNRQLYPVITDNSNPLLMICTLKAG